MHAFVHTLDHFGRCWKMNALSGQMHFLHSVLKVWLSYVIHTWKARRVITYMEADTILVKV